MLAVGVFGARRTMGVPPFGYWYAATATSITCDPSSDRRALRAGVALRPNRRRTSAETRTDVQGVPELPADDGCAAGHVHDGVAGRRAPPPRERTAEKRHDRAGVRDVGHARDVGPMGSV